MLRTASKVAGAARYTGVRKLAEVHVMEARRRRLAALPSLAGDTLLTLMAALFSAVHFLVVNRGPHGPPPFPDGPHPDGAHPWAVALALLCASALLVRSRWPVGSLLAVGVMGTLYLATGNNFVAILPAVLIAFYSAAAYSTLPRLQVWAIAGGAGGALLLSKALGQDLFLTGLLLDGGWLLIAVLLGEALRGRRAYAREVELRAIESERTHQEIAQRRVAEERLQIARELHDILAHTVALINVQAGVAAHVIDQQPEQAREALNNIKTASRTTLQELRALVGVLRDGDGRAPRTPAPGLAALDDLILTVRDAGLPIDLEVDRPDGPLPATIDVAAYRILQEALTNVIKHAGQVVVRVTVEQHNGTLELDVTNSAGTLSSLTPAGGLGHGIIGMRERAAALGGSLRAGPRPDGGYQVHAMLPIPGETA
jgi:signal transduction histidine kinase